MSAAESRDRIDSDTWLWYNTETRKKTAKKRRDENVLTSTGFCFFWEFFQIFVIGKRFCREKEKMNENFWKWIKFILAGDMFFFLLALEMIIRVWRIDRNRSTVTTSTPINNRHRRRATNQNSTNISTHETFHCHWSVSPTATLNPPATDFKSFDFV